MNELHVTLGDRRYSFAGGATVRIGRSPDNDIVVGDPTVSRQHAQLSHGPRGWEFVNVGRALSYLNGEPVTRAVLSGPARIRLASLDGPALAITPVPAAPSPAAPRPAEAPSAGPPSAGPPSAGPPSAGPPSAEPPAARDPAPEPAPAELAAEAAAPANAAAPADAAAPAEAASPADAAAPADAAPADAAPADAAPADAAPANASPADAAPADAAAPARAAAPADAAAAADRPDATSVMASPLAEPLADPLADPLAGGLAGYPAHGMPPRVRVAAGESVDEIATALHILIPIRSWLHDPGWRQFLRLLVIPYGLLPLIFIALFAGSDSLATPGWAYSLYIAPLWAIVFWLLIRPGPVGRLEWLIGAGAIAFSLVWIRLVTVNLNQVMGRPGKPLSFPGAIGVGVNEEITKALPILLAALLLLKLRSVKLDVRMWMFLGAIVGLAFGVTEQAGYTLQDIQAITSAQANSEVIVEVLAFAERVFVDGFQHALWAGVSAFFIGIAVNYPRRRIPLIALGIAIPAALHGLYDWSAGAFASLWVPIIIQALSVFLFLGYTMSAAAIERRVRQTPMFRGESMLFERITDSGSFRREG